MADDVGLPPGFEIDPPAGSTGLPPGFEIDAPAPQASATSVPATPNPQPEQSSGVGHALARTGRDLVAGVGGLADIGYAAVPPIYHGARSALSSMGVDLPAAQDTSKMMPSNALTSLYDSVTNNAGVPQTSGEAIVDKATQFLTQAGSGGMLGEAMAATNPAVAASRTNALTTPVSASQVLAAQAPKTPIEALSVAGAGAGSEAAHQLAPDSSVAPIAGAVAGSLLAPGSASAVNGIKEAVAPAVSQVVKPLAQKALDYGIPLTRSQVGDSRFTQGLASVAEKLPLSGGVQFRNAQQTAFNKAVASTFGEDTENITPEVIDKAYKNIGQKFDDIHAGLQVKVDDDTIDQLSSIDDAAKNYTTGDHYKIVKNNIDKFLNDVDENGIINGKKLNSLRSNISKALKSTKNDAAPYLKDIHDLVINTAVGDDPVTQQALIQARQQYKNLKTIESLANPEGNISPALLTNKVRQSYSNFPRGGGGKLGDLARIGSTFLKEKVPNSGTPERQMMMNIGKGVAAIGTGYASPMTAITGAGALGLGRAYNAFNQSQRGVAAGLNKVPAAGSSYRPGLINAMLHTQGQ